jgi:hypothetical protein
LSIFLSRSALFAPSQTAATAKICVSVGLPAIGVMAADVWLRRILAPLLAPIHYCLEGVVIELTCQAKACATFSIRTMIR